MLYGPLCLLVTVIQGFPTAIFLILIIKCIVAVDIIIICIFDDELTWGESDLALEPGALFLDEVVHPTLTLKYPLAAHRLRDAAVPVPAFVVLGLQNAMTSSEERTSAEADGYRIERALMDCVAPPSKGGDVIHQCPRADSR